MTPTAKVYLVGAGPGDPELLTRKAVRLLAEADVVIHDRLISAEILSLANPRAVILDGGKQFGQQEEIQAEIYRHILQYGSSVRTILRLKSGDPMVFGRGGEELEFLIRNGFEAEVVPGVSAAIAAPTLAGIPLTYRGIAASFAVIAGHRQSVCSLDWTACQAIDTLVVLMGVELRDVIAGSLIGAGRPASQPVGFVINASTGRQRIVESTLGAIAHGGVAVESPAVMIIGEVVRMRSGQICTALQEVLA